MELAAPAADYLKPNTRQAPYLFTTANQENKKYFLDGFYLRIEIKHDGTTINIRNAGRFGKFEH